MKKLLSFSIPIALGGALLVLAYVGGVTPERKPIAETIRPLRIITVKAMDVVPRALGYGTAEPEHVWRAITEVEGPLVEIHPNLRAGARIAKGETLLRIDPEPYALNIEKYQGEIDKAQADLDALAQREKNDTASLAIERESLVLAKRDLKRFQDVRKKDLGTDSDVDEAHEKMLAQQQKVQDLENSLALIPSDRQALQASGESQNQPS